MPRPTGSGRLLLLLSIAYVLARRVLSFLLLRFRSEGSKELELLCSVTSCLSSDASHPTAAR